VARQVGPSAHQQDGHPPQPVAARQGASRGRLGGARPPPEVPWRRPTASASTGDDRGRSAGSSGGNRIRSPILPSPPGGRLAGTGGRPERHEEPLVIVAAVTQHLDLVDGGDGLELRRVVKIEAPRPGRSRAPDRGEPAGRHRLQQVGMGREPGRT
jgi:hypothetical protein